MDGVSNLRDTHPFASCGRGHERIEEPEAGRAAKGPVVWTVVSVHPLRRRSVTPRWTPTAPWRPTAVEIGRPAPYARAAEPPVLLVATHRNHRLFDCRYRVLTFIWHVCNVTTVVI